MIREITKEDYPKICGWWSEQKFPIIPEELLPLTGYLCNEVAAAYLYLSQTPLAWIGWIVSDPSAEKTLRSESLDAVIRFTESQAKTTGARIVLAPTAFWPLTQRLRRLGFTDGDKKVSHMIKVI